MVPTAHDLLHGREVCTSIDYAKVPGVMVITHDHSGKMFVGYASDLYIRTAFFRRQLEFNKCKIQLLQEAYNEHPGVSVLCTITQSIDEAIVLKQTILNDFKSSDMLFNKYASAKRARYSSRSEAEIEKRHLTHDWGKAWASWIDGTTDTAVRIGSRVYRSMKEAALYLNIPQAIVKKRIENPDFPFWVKLHTTNPKRKAVSQ